ncbi:MAG: Na(+)-translocating NADH-quinone reductase subunit C [Aeromonadales bacterium]|nr:Na(+)-translocating NADH-quinone reductase subunit C [Aeromonadales bacterium]MDY2891476.1 Na(+)-translocating NADH-quinone reductase subunit C [Succinivibrio sp.]
MFKLNKDSVLGTFVIIIGFCLVCSVLVSSAVVALNPYKAAAIANDRQSNILKVSGFDVEGSIAATYKKHIEAHLLDVDSGALADNGLSQEKIDGYDFKSLGKKPETSEAIAKDDDTAGIRTRSKLMPIYFSKDDQGKVVRVILPFYGQGLWSTIYGYVAVDPKDGNTIKGVTFYDHGETPGLGGEIENPRWQALWVDKHVNDQSGAYKFGIMKHADHQGAGKDFQVDALSGATLTSRGVDGFSHYWLGKAYQPFLKNLSKGEIIK